MPDYLKSFDEIPTYSDSGSQNQTCRDIMPDGVIPGLAVGYNILEGPGRVGFNCHDWDQIFVVVQGSGLLLRGEERVPIKAQCIVLIPAGTVHDVHVAPGERIEYVYINKDRC
jgi:mannose-6-phosphate isomerase-like protein (cupin superfamily)